jgi:hypothetical protein
MLVLKSYLVTVRRCLTKLTFMMILLGDCVTAKKDLKLESIDVVLDGFRHAVIARKHTHTGSDLAVKPKSRRTSWRPERINHSFSLAPVYDFHRPAHEP